MQSLGVFTALSATGAYLGMQNSPPVQAARLPSSPHATGAAAMLTARQSAPSTIEALIRLIPDTPDNRHTIYLNDFAKFRQLSGAVPPTATSAENEVGAYLAATVGWGLVQAPYIAAMPDTKHAWENRAARGFHLGMIDQTVDAGVNPLAMLGIIAGQFDPAAITQAFTSCTNCIAASRTDVAGTPFYAWGADNQMDLANRLALPFYDDLGRGGRVAVTPGHVYHTLGSPLMVAALQTSAGQQPSIADLSPFQAIASGLGQLGVYSALLSDEPEPPETRSTARPAPNAPPPPPPRPPALHRAAPPEQLAQAKDPATLLRPYQHIGLGTGKDETGYFTAVALHHDSAQSATENAEILPRRIEVVPSLRTNQPLKDLFTAVQTSTDGSLMLAKLHLTGTRASAPWMAWWLMQDSLLLFR